MALGRADTVFALSSGQGVAGVAVVRLSGPAARAVLQAMAGGLPEPRRAVLRALRDPGTGEVLDHGLLLWFPGPASFTGEDMAELQVHGSRAVLDGLFAALARVPGVRPAEAGEFSLRAFVNGKLDLTEVEGLADLLRARTARQRRLALHQAGGAARAETAGWRQALIGILGRVEAMVDFADEADVVREAAAEVRPRLLALRDAMAVALRRAAQVRGIRDGMRVVLAGPPNAGKSSLLNRIAARPAAIVSALPGTTRDVVEVEVELAGLPVVFADTAGLRDGTVDEIEAEGMARSRAAVAEADLVLWVTAPDIPPVEVPTGLELLRVRNKADLESELIRNEPSDHHVSAQSGAGMEDLLAAISGRLAAQAGDSDAVSFGQARQQQALRATLASLDQALAESWERLEVLAESLRAAAVSLGRITGEIGVEELLDAIFQDFCVGK